MALLAAAKPAVPAASALAAAQRFAPLCGPSGL